MRFYDEVMTSESMMMQNKKESKIKLFAKSIVDKIRRLCVRLVNVLKDLAKVNPEFTKVVASGIALSAFWNTVDGTKELHGASYKVFKRLTDQVLSNVRRFYTNDVIVKKMLTGILELGKVFFKLYASKKLFEFAKDSRKDRLPIRRRHADFGEAIISKIRSMCNSFVGECRWLARKYPEAAGLLSAAIGMSTFWDAVDGVRDIGNGFIKIFKRLFAKIEKYEKYYTNEAIVGNFLRGIGRLAKAFFKLYTSKKIIAFSQGY